MTIKNCTSKDNHRSENSEMLKSANLKSTKQRRFLINCLRHSDSPLTADEIYSLIKEEDSINLSTVYRTLNALVESNIVIKHTISEGVSVFQLNSEHHKHVLTCKICGKTSFVDICPIASLIDEISIQTGYEITGHNLEFLGICPECMDELEEAR